MNWAYLLLAVALVESSGDPSKINKSEQAYGLTQIRQGAVTDLNGHWGTSYTLQDFLNNPPLSRWAFVHYGRIYKARTPEQYCRIWNGGPDGWYEPETLKYWTKVQQQYKELLCRQRY